MRIKITISGLVQGMGFRPFIHRLATELRLSGYVLNNTEGVLIEAEGEKSSLDEFLIRIDRDKPELSNIFSLQHAYLEKKGFDGFEIRESAGEGEKQVSILPDIAVCKECREEITDPKDRRFIYPFTNCTNCGPRFTIIKSLPYDRQNTSMQPFSMCPDCEREYNDTGDRRFHAQPNACHSCGPHISLHDCHGQFVCEKERALEKVTNLLRKGYIVAVKGLGGYHLLCDATNEETIARLRKKKNREEKPMAVMFPDLEAIKDEACLSPLEERAILSIEKPIVIVQKNKESRLADSVSPGNSTAGVFLPYTPLHYLMLRKLKKPVVATSANVTDEPIAKDEKDAFARLSKIADYYLVHNRKIIRRADDSVVRIMWTRQVPIRRSRGFAPMPVLLPFQLKKPVLALGPSMNSTIALGFDDKVYISQHIGDLDTPLATQFYEETIEDFLRLFDIRPEVVVSDMHPGYYSTKYGERKYSEKLLQIQHHYAHILSCMVENEVAEDSEVIGFAFDGTGYGPDKTIWGGEVLTVSYRGFERAYHLLPFKLPGGDKAVKEPGRTALSLLYETFGDETTGTDALAMDNKERSFYLDMIRKNVNSPSTSSMGRLFDGVAAILGCSHKTSYHAQAAIELEQLALKSDETASYPFSLQGGTIDYRPIIEMLVTDLRQGVARAVIAGKFHNTIVKIIVFTAEILRKEKKTSLVALSGGVFQNAIILEKACTRLQKQGFTPLIHQLLPPNDGGISLGQAVASRYSAG